MALCRHPAARARTRAGVSRPSRLRSIETPIGANGFIDLHWDRTHHFSTGHSNPMGVGSPDRRGVVADCLCGFESRVYLGVGPGEAIFGIAGPRNNPGGRKIERIIEAIE
jgi:hypothetical protein